jgi:hypothetical protein
MISETIEVEAGAEIKAGQLTTVGSDGRVVPFIPKGLRLFVAPRDYAADEVILVRWTAEGWKVVGDR